MIKIKPLIISPTFLMNKEAKRLLATMADIYSLGKTPHFLVDEKARQIGRKPLKIAPVLGTKKLSKEIRLVVKWIRQIDVDVRKGVSKLLVIMREFESKAIHLKNLKKIYLAELEQLENDQKEDVFRVMREIKAQLETLEVGVVSAINYDDREAFCMIDGVDEAIIYPGGTINSVKVVKIHRNKVEFEKDGKKWVQVIGKPANPA